MDGVERSQEPLVQRQHVGLDEGERVAGLGAISTPTTSNPAR